MYEKLSHEISELMSCSEIVLSKSLPQGAAPCKVPPGQPAACPPGWLLICSNITMPMPQHNPQELVLGQTCCNTVSARYMPTAAHCRTAINTVCYTFKGVPAVTAKQSSMVTFLCCK